MNIRPADSTLTVHFSAAKIARVDEVEFGIVVAYDDNQRIVDVTTKARVKMPRVDIVNIDKNEMRERMTYDPSIDALYIYANSVEIRKTEEVLPGLIVDYDADGFVSGLEFLNASDFFSDQTMAAIRKSATLL